MHNTFLFFFLSSSSLSTLSARPFLYHTHHLQPPPYHTLPPRQPHPQCAANPGPCWPPMPWCLHIPSDTDALMLECWMEESERSQLVLVHAILVARGWPLGGGHLLQWGCCCAVFGILSGAFGGGSGSGLTGWTHSTGWWWHPGALLQWDIAAFVLTTVHVFILHSHQGEGRSHGPMPWASMRVSPWCWLKLFFYSTIRACLILWGFTCGASGAAVV